MQATQATPSIVTAGPGGAPAASVATAPAPAVATGRPLLELARITKVFQTDDLETRALSSV